MMVAQKNPEERTQIVPQGQAFPVNENSPGPVFVSEEYLLFFFFFLVGV